MTRKFISLVTAIVTLDVYLRSQLYSNDPLFLFASNQPIINLGLLVLVSWVVVISFRGKFSTRVSYVLTVLFAATCGIIGGIGTLFSDLGYQLSNFLLPLDYLFLLEAGVVLSICALSYRPVEVSYHFKLSPRLKLFNRLAFRFPKSLIPPISAGLSKPHNFTNFLKT